LLWSGVEVANLNLTLEFSGRADDSTGGSAYAAMNTLIINLAGCCGGLVAGAIAQALRDWTWVTAVKTFTLYDVLFALSALLRLIAVVVFLPHIQEPDARPTWEAVKFVTASIRGRALALTRA
jgi:MFS family permease